MSTTARKTGPHRPDNAALHAFVHLPPDTLRHILKAGRKQWKRYCSELKRCQQRFSPKAVHSFRIAARRLLSYSELISGFSGKEQTERLCELVKKQLDVFDELRDSQVQCALLKRWNKRMGAAVEFRKHLGKRQKRLIRRTRKDLKMARTKKLGKLLRACREHAEAFTPARKQETGKRIILRTITDAFNDTVSRRERIVSADSETIHRTRVAFKKFRYMVEALAPFVGVEKAFLKQLQEYQTLMGDVQDLVVLHAAFDKYALKCRMPKGDAGPFNQELTRSTRKATRKYFQEADQLYGFWLPAATLETGSGNGKAGLETFGRPAARFRAGKS